MHSFGRRPPALTFLTLQRSANWLNSMYDTSMCYVCVCAGIAGQTSDKSDVYAFGVMVLEMMTGMQAVDARRPEGCEALHDLLQPALQAVQLMQVH